MSKFKVLLVYPNYQMVNLLPSNIGLLTACLKQAGLEVRLFDTTQYRTEEKSLDEIRVANVQLRKFDLKDKGVEYKDSDIFEDFSRIVDEYNPDLIGMSATDDTYHLGIELLASVKERGHFTIVGGVFPTFSPERVIRHEAVDSLCRGEGEKALVELCQGLASGSDITSINNLWVKVGDEIYKNEMRKPIDLAELPYEDFSLFEDSRIYRPMQGKVYRMVPVTIDRGCPFACTYCAAPSIKGLYREANLGPYFRTKDADKVIEEIKYLVEKHQGDYIYFNSETFFARDEKTIKRFAEMYVREIGLPFWCQTRVETINPERAKILKDMNCDRVSIGLEHGNEEFRKKILKKTFTNEQVIMAFKSLEGEGIPVTANNIIGFPDETRGLAFDTIRLNRKIKTDTVNALFFVPYTGTPLRKYSIEKGYVDPDARTDSCIKNTIMNMPNFPPHEIKGLVRTFPLYVKLPESHFEDIRLAEQLTEEGDRMHAELTKMFHEKFV